MTNIDDILYAPVTWGRPGDAVLSHEVGRHDDPDRLRSKTHKLLVVLEEALAPALEHYLFELNNSFTRQSVVGSISGILANQEGLHDYRVVCDETNNGPETIANHELVVDVWFKPAYTVEIGHFRAKLGE